jgi:hypothetical protein
MKEIDAMTEAEKAWIIVHKIHELKNLLMDIYGEEMKEKIEAIENDIIPF